MANAEGVKFTFVTAWEGSQAARLAHAQHTVAPSGQYFVRVSLVTNIPHQPVVRGIEDVVKRNGQFDHTKARPKMPPGLAYGVQQKVAQFPCQRRENSRIHGAQVGRAVDLIQQRRVGPCQRNFI